MWAKLLRIPRPYLYSGILLFASLGAYATNGQPFDLLLLLVLGLIGMMMRRFGFPVLPMVVGVILGPSAEQQALRALQISDGALSGLLDGPVAQWAYLLVIAILVTPLVARLLRRRLGRRRDDVEQELVESRGGAER